MSTQVFKINRGEFGFALADPGVVVDDATIADYSDFSCRITSGTLTATQNVESEAVPGTFCDPASETNTPEATTFELDLSVLQDPDVSTLAGLQKFLWDNDSSVGANQTTARPNGVVWFFLGLEQGSPPKAIGQCYIAPIDFGGEPRVVLTADASFPVEGRPTIEWGTVDDPIEDLTTSIFGETPAPFADLAALAADPVYGDGGTSAPSAFTTGQFVRLQDASTANYSGAAWSAGVAS